MVGVPLGKTLGHGKTLEETPMTAKEKEVVEECLYATKMHCKEVMRLMRKGQVKADVLLGMEITVDKLQSVVDGKPLFRTIAC
jgi:hypothetical protein